MLLITLRYVPPPIPQWSSKYPILISVQFSNGLQARVQSKLTITVQFPGSSPTKDLSAVQKAVEDIIKTNKAELAITSDVQYEWKYRSGAAINPKEFTFTFKVLPGGCLQCNGKVTQSRNLFGSWKVSKDSFVDPGGPAIPQGIRLTGPSPWFS